MIQLNMLTRADSVKGQGVMSATEEQIELVTQNLPNFNVVVNEKPSKADDILHFHTINLDFYLAGYFYKQKTPTITSVHFLPETLKNSISLPEPVKQLFYKYVLSFYKNSDYLVTVNPLFIDKLVDYGVNREKITYIPNFVSRDTFYKITDRSKAELRQAFDLEPDAFTIVSAGQLQTRKGVLEFIELAEQLPEMQFVWAGDFAFKNISEGRKAILKKMENLPPNVHFIGLVDRERMNDFFNMADVMFQPSFEELFPMTILECMNANIPLLLRDLDEYRPILADYYLKGNSQAEFKQLLEQLASDQQFYQSACQSAKRGEQFYSKEHILAEWQAFYQRVAEENGLS